MSESDLCRLLDVECGPNEGLGLACDSPAACDGTACDECDDASAPPCAARYPLLLRRIARRAEGEEVRASEDRAAADGLFDELMRVPAAERVGVVELHDRYVSFAFAERLLATSLETRRERPEASQELARLALGVAERLDPSRYGSGLVADLKARSWAYLGDAWSDSAPSAAREAFRLARSLLAHGSGDPFEEAEVLALAATGLPEAGSAATALEGLGRAEAIYRSAGDLRSLGDTLLHKARLVAREGDHLGAAAILLDAAQVLNGIAAPGELAEIGADTAVQLVAAGCPDEAWSELGRVRSLAGADLDPGLALRLRWIEGRIAAALDLAAEARGHLEAARQGLLAAGRPREAALVQLDLAALAVRTDGPEYDRAMGRLGEEIDHLVLTGQLPREQIAALALLGQAAERRALRPDLVESVTGFLDRVG